MLAFDMHASHNADEDRMEILFIVLFAYLRRMKSQRLQKAAEAAALKAKEILPLDHAKQAIPALIK